jgi:hypothetical protein
MKKKQVILEHENVALPPECLQSIGGLSLNGFMERGTPTENQRAHNFGTGFFRPSLASADTICPCSEMAAR